MPNAFIQGLLDGMRMRQVRAQEGRLAGQEKREQKTYELGLEKEARVKSALAKFLKEVSTTDKGMVGADPSTMGGALLEAKGTPADRLGGYLGEQPAPGPEQSLLATMKTRREGPQTPGYEEINKALLEGIATEPSAAGTLAQLAQMQPGYQKKAQDLALQKIYSEEAIKSQFRERKPVALGNTGQYFDWDETTGEWAIKGEPQPRGMGAGQWLEKDAGGKWTLKGTARVRPTGGAGRDPSTRISAIDIKIAQLEKSKLSLDKPDIFAMILAANPALASKVGNVGQTVTPEQKRQATKAIDKAIKTLKQERQTLQKYVAELPPDEEDEEEAGEVWTYDATGKRVMK